MENKNRTIKILRILFSFYQILGVIAIYDVFISTYVMQEYMIAKGIIIFGCIISATIMLKHFLITNDEKK